MPPVCVEDFPARSAARRLRWSHDGELATCDVVIPAATRPPRCPPCWPSCRRASAPIVVDNGSRDDTAEVARRLGAEVVVEPRPGYGAAVHAGLEAATRRFVAVIDGDGSMDPADLVAAARGGRRGRADLAVGRRRPVARGVWPWHARAGNALVLWWLRRRLDLPLHDIAPMRVAGAQALLDLGVEDRRFGYPVELLQRAGAARWRLERARHRYHPRAAGTTSKVSGSVVGTRRGPPATSPGCSREAARGAGGRQGARSPGRSRPGSAASSGWSGRPTSRPRRCWTPWRPAPRRTASSAATSPSRATSTGRARAEDLLAATVGWTVHPQRGDGFAERLVQRAHRHRGGRAGAGRAGRHGHAAAVRGDAPRGGRGAHGPPDAAVLGPAYDGGWWLLGVGGPHLLTHLGEVPMSTAGTGELTRRRCCVRARGSRRSPRSATSTRSRTPRRWPGPRPAAASRGPGTTRSAAPSDGRPRGAGQDVRALSIRPSAANTIPAVETSIGDRGAGCSTERGTRA